MSKVVGYWDYCPELVPKKSYTEAQGRATMKWMNKNKERYNEQQRIRHGIRMRTDLNYRNMKAKSQKKANEKYRLKMIAYKEQKKADEQEMIRLKEENTKLLKVIEDETNISENLNNIIKELKEGSDFSEDFTDDEFFSEDFSEDDDTI